MKGGYFTGPPSDHPTLRDGLRFGLEVRRWGNTDHPATAAEYWAEQRTAIATSAAYRAMLWWSAETKLPTSYPCDLTEWDRRIVVGTDDELCFLWCLRECGTHIIPLMMADPRDQRPWWAKPTLALDYWKAVQGAHRHEPPWYYWNGRTLAPVTDARGEEIIRIWTDRERFGARRKVAS